MFSTEFYAGSSLYYQNGVSSEWTPHVVPATLWVSYVAVCVSLTIREEPKQGYCPRIQCIRVGRAKGQRNLACFIQCHFLGLKTSILSSKATFPALCLCSHSLFVIFFFFFNVHVIFSSLSGVFEGFGHFPVVTAAFEVITFSSQ